MTPGTTNGGKGFTGAFLNYPEQFDIDFHKINDNHELTSVLNENKIDLIILARYMQIIPDDIVRLYKNKIIRRRIRRS